MPVGAKTVDVTAQLSARREKAEAALERKRLQLPRRPRDYDLPKLPNRLTDMGDEELMELFVHFVRYQDYLAGQLALVEIDEHTAENILEVVKAKHLIVGWTGESNSRVAVAKAQATLDPAVIEAQEVFETSKAKRKLFNVMVESLARDASVISREVTRRVGSHDQGGRVDRWRP